MDHEVFISYSSANIQTAQAICHALESNRIKCWMAPRDIRPGAEYGDIIEEAIVACRKFPVKYDGLPQRVLEDFQLVDLTLIDSAIPSASAF